MAQLQPGGDHHHLVAEGGSWWRDTQLQFARRDRDADRVEWLEAEAAAAKRELLRRLTRA